MIAKGDFACRVLLWDLINQWIHLLFRRLDVIVICQPLFRYCVYIYRITMVLEPLSRLLFVPIPFILIYILQIIWRIIILSLVAANRWFRRLTLLIYLPSELEPQRIPSSLLLLVSIQIFIQLICETTRFTLDMLMLLLVHHFYLWLGLIHEARLGKLRFNQDICLLFNTFNLLL